MQCGFQYTAAIRPNIQDPFSGFIHSHVLSRRRGKGLPIDHLLSELRRRSVFRAAAAYLVAGWLVFQVVGAIEGAAGLPDWADGLALVLLVTGLPIVLLIAWAFELTPEGLQKTEPANDDFATLSLGGADYILIVLLVLVLGAVGFQIATRPLASSQIREASDAGYEERPPQLAEAPSASTIAVLPFADLSAIGDQGYFGDGIAEEILNVLARMDALDVTSRTSAFAFKSQSELSIRDIASSLGVRHVLEGSVRTAGGTIRITAQLIDAQTDQHLWSDTYDRELTAENVFAIQDEIAGAITTELADRLGVTINVAPVAERGTTEVSAYEAFLEGRELFINRNYTNLPRAVAALEQAVQTDPQFARAWGVLAMAYIVSPSWGFVERDYFALGHQAATRALEIDTDNTDGLTALGYHVRWSGTPDTNRAIQYLEQAIAGDPLNTTAHLWLAQFWRDGGFFDRAERILEDCLDIDPDYHMCLYDYAGLAILQGRYEDSKQRVLDVFSTNLEMSYPEFMAEAANRDDDVFLTLLLSELADTIAANARWVVTDIGRALSDEDFDRGAALERFEARLRATGTEVTDPYVITTYLLAFRAYDRIPLQATGWWWYTGYPGLAGSEARRRIIEYRGLPDFWREHGFPPQCRPVGDDDFDCD